MKNISIVSITYKAFKNRQKSENDLFSFNIIFNSLLHQKVYMQLRLLWKSCKWFDVGINTSDRDISFSTRDIVNFQEKFNGKVLIAFKISEAVLKKVWMIFIWYRSVIFKFLNAYWIFEISSNKETNRLVSE